MSYYKTQPQRPPSGGRVYIDNEAVLDIMLQDSDALSPNSIRAAKARARRSNPEDSEHAESRETTKQKNIEHYKEISRRTEMEAQKSIERSLKKKQLDSEKKFDHLTNDILEAKELLDSIDESISLQQEAARNKTRRQFEDWNMNVHGKIQAEILQKLDAKGYKQLNKERNADYAKFLNITNRKSAIFRDIIIESEYDPLEPNRRAIKAKTGKMKDPTLMILQKHEDESGTLVTKKKTQLGRDSLNVELWASGQIEATPYGRFNKMMGIDGGEAGSSQPNSSTQKAPNPTMRSAVNFDHFNYPKDKASLDAEMPKGKRIVEPFRNPKEANVAKPSGHPNTNWMY